MSTENVVFVIVESGWISSLVMTEIGPPSSPRFHETLSARASLQSRVKLRVRQGKSKAINGKTDG